MWTHVNQMYEEVEDGLQNYKAFYSIFVILALYKFSLNEDDIAKPVQNSEYDSPPNQKLTEKGHFLKLLYLIMN